MKNIYFITILCLVSMLFGLNPAVSAAKLDLAFGQVTKSCIGKTITSRLSLSQKLDTVNAVTSTVRIECGESVTVDNGSSFKLSHGLIVEGELLFADGDSRTMLTTPYILVRGSFRIGTKKNPHKSSLHIILAAYPTDLKLKNLSGNKAFDSMMNFGKKALVVYGGSIEIYGEVSGNPFTNLVQTAKEGTKEFVVRGDNTKHWRAGDKLAVAPSVHDVDGKHNSYVTIKSIQKVGKNSKVLLNENLTGKHEVRTHKLTDGTNRVVTMAPEVMKVNRNVVVHGMPLNTDLKNWYELKDNQAEIGGHFTIAHTVEKIVVQGIELVAMGQPGKLGRYPIHTHFCGTVLKKSRISSNSIHHSRQRCVVLHATNKMKVKSNVAFLTTGHCFMTEDGLEKYNKFIGNIAMSYRLANTLIHDDSNTDKQSDDNAGGFWAASATNDFTKNVAVGGWFGFWFESHTKLRGQSRDVKLPGWKEANMELDNMGKFKSNTAHSNNIALGTYPNGLKPTKLAKLENFYAWTVRFGWQAHIGRNQALRNSLLIDIQNDGIQAQQQEALEVSDTTIVGHLFNDFHFNCENTYNRGLSFEAVLNYFSWLTGFRGNRLTNVHIQDFTTSRNCRKYNYGFHLLTTKGDLWWPTSSRFHSVTFDNVDTKMKIDWPKDEPYERQVGFAVDGFGAIPGKGFVLSDNFEGESVLIAGCSRQSAVDHKLYMCPGQCWRTISIAYKSIDGYEKTKLRFTNSRSGITFDVTPLEIAQWVDRVVDRIVIKLIPAGNYVISIIGNNGEEVPRKLYDESYFAHYKMDIKHSIPGPACDEDIILQVGEKVVPIENYL